ncbi:hypothetical protein G7Y79_00030g065100 [Physcia stellaris]|nr:hypothetical protein G7Y79_00030g065100 [Physcia stellaris]
MMDAMDKMTAQFSRGHAKMEESNAMIRHGITEITTSLKSSSTSTIKAGPRNWAAVAAAPPAPRTTANKNTEIIVRLNDSEKKQQLSQYETTRIANEINTCITEKDIQAKGIRAVKKLPSGDLAIHAVNAEEAEKLRDNSAWTAVLGKRARAVVPTYAVMVSGIEVKKFDLTTADGRETAMRKIREENENVEELKGMEILYMSWRNKPTAMQQYHTLVIEVSTPEMGNSMLDNSIMYNVNNSRTQVMIPLFETEGIEKFDILAIQEPWKNSFQPTTNNRLSQQFELLYMPDAATRVCMFVNKRIAKTVYSHTFHNRNLISLRMQAVDDRIINIHNMYNPCKGSEDFGAIQL